MAQDTYLENDVRPNDVEALFEAAACLYDTQLRNVCGTQLVGVAIPCLRLHLGCVWIGRESIVGHGLMLCESLADYRRWMRALVQGEPVRPKAAALALELQQSCRTSPRRMSEIGRYGWRIADWRAHPVPYRYDPRLFVTPICRRDVQIVTALCDALATLPDMLDVTRAPADALRTVWPARIGGRVVLVDVHVAHGEATETDRALAGVQGSTLRAAG